MFKAQICDRGCKPIIAHYDKWARKNVVIPVINVVMKKMGATEHTKAIVDLADDVVKAIKEKCAPTLGKKHFCQDPATLQTFGGCLKENLMPVVMKKVGEFLPLVAEPMCIKEMKYLKSPDLWEKIIPNYMNKYAKACKSL